MNTETGQMYYGNELFKAIQRKEPLEIIEDPTPEQLADMERRSAELIEKTRSAVNVTWRKKFKV